MAPELLAGKDHSDKVDWWSLGIMAYEFFHGKRPFSLTRGEGESDKKKMMNAIKTTQLKNIFSSHCSESLRSLITGLLEIDPVKRFGADEVKKHIFFKDINWDELIIKNVKPPLIPDSNSVNFKPDANVEEVFGLSKPKENLNVPLTDEQQLAFKDWDWIAIDQELPEPDPAIVAKYNKKKKKKILSVKKNSNPNSMTNSRNASDSRNDVNSINFGALGTNESGKKSKGSLTERENDEQSQQLPRNSE